MDAIQAMCTRRSIRKYTADPVKEEDLRKILDCGRLAPTGVNRQAWRFIAGTDAAVKAAVAEATDYGKFIASAPVVIAVAIGPDAACPNEDSAAAACNMLNAAHALGYGGCWIGSNGNATAERVGKVLRLPAGWKIYALFSVGVPAEEAHRDKKRLEEVVSYNGF